MCNTDGNYIAWPNFQMYTSAANKVHKRKKVRHGAAERTFGKNQRQWHSCSDTLLCSSST